MLKYSLYTIKNSTTMQPWNAIPSILLVFVWRPFLLIVYKFVVRRAIFNCI